MLLVDWQGGLEVACRSGSFIESAATLQPVEKEPNVI
jgi:hypothetical protein